MPRVARLRIRWAFALMTNSYFVADVSSAFLVEKAWGHDPARNLVHSHNCVRVDHTILGTRAFPTERQDSKRGHCN